MFAVWLLFKWASLNCLDDADESEGGGGEDAAAKEEEENPLAARSQS